MLAAVAREHSFHLIERVLLESNSHQRTKSLDHSLVLQIVCRQLLELYRAQRNAIRFVQTNWKEWHFAASIQLACGGYAARHIRVATNASAEAQ
jgi:hypothetical protein